MTLNWLLQSLIKNASETQNSLFVALSSFSNSFYNASKTQLDHSYFGALYFWLYWHSLVPADLIWFGLAIALKRMAQRLLDDKPNQEPLCVCRRDPTAVKPVAQLGDTAADKWLTSLRKSVSLSLTYFTRKATTALMKILRSGTFSPDQAKAGDQCCCMQLWTRLWVNHTVMDALYCLHTLHHSLLASVMKCCMMMVS